MRIDRVTLLSLVLVLIIGLTWFVTTKFWFDNYDLAYMNQYLNINNFPGGLDLIQVIRGHVLIKLLLYPFFQINPSGYYLVTNLLHALVTVTLFIFLLKFSKDIKLSFLVSILFGVSIVYSNTLFEGVFNSYYPALLLIASICVLPLILEKSKIFIPGRLILISTLTILGFALRETALVIPILILLALILTSRNLKVFKNKIIYFIVPLIISILYLIFRQKVLGVLQSDLSDDAVQARMAYVASGRWPELFASIVVNFLRLSAEQVFSYPILYFARDRLSAFFTFGGGQPQDSAVLFAVVSGLVSWFLIALSRTLTFGNKAAGRLWLFGLGWFVIFNLFTAAAVPFPAHVISQSYNYTSVLSRYNYFAYFGLTILIFSLLISKRRRILFLPLLIIWLIYNFFAIQVSGNLLYKSYHIQAKDFYQKMFNKRFPQNTYLYYNFSGVNNLRDRMWELVYAFAKRSSPSSNFTFETTLANTQKEYLSGNATLTDIFAYDLDENGFLIDKTEVLRQALANIQTIPLSKGEKENEFNAPDHTLANMKYDLQFEARAIGVDLKAKEDICSGKSIGAHPVDTVDLLSYLQKRTEFLSNAKVEVSSSRSDYSMFPYYNKDELLDNQFGPESSWMPNTFLADQWLILDLGRIKNISGFSWISDGRNGNPQSYELFKSNDKINWEKVLSVVGNKQPSRLDTFEKTDVRYVKMIIHSTQIGQPVNLREVEALDYPQSFSQKYKEWERLIDDSYNIFCFAETLSSKQQFEFTKIVWETNKKTVGEKNVIFYTGGNWKKYNIPIVNWEPYSESKKILDEEYTNISFLPGSSGLKYEIRNAKLVPSKN